MDNTVDKTKDNTVDKNDKQTIFNKKVEVATKFLLKLYEIIGKKKIDKLEDFVNLHYEDFRNIEGLKLLESMKDELFLYFNKSKCRYRSLAKIKNFNLNFTKFLCPQIGYELEVRNKLIAEDNKVKSETSYHIVKYTLI